MLAVGDGDCPSERGPKRAETLAETLASLALFHQNLRKTVKRTKRFSARHWHALGFLRFLVAIGPRGPKFVVAFLFTDAQCNSSSVHVGLQIKVVNTACRSKVKVPCRRSRTPSRRRLRRQHKT